MFNKKNIVWCVSVPLAVRAAAAAAVIIIIIIC
jgi:hypothetical protein